MTVLKADGRREQFDKTKILSGLKLACNKRPISVKQMESIAEAIEAHFASAGNAEIQAKDIGELVVEKLRDVDEIAFVRFASVYRQFKDKQEFIEELKKLMDQ